MGGSLGGPVVRFFVVVGPVLRSVLATTELAARGLRGKPRPATLKASSNFVATETVGGSSRQKVCRLTCSLPLAPARPRAPQVQRPSAIALARAVAETGKAALCRRLLADAGTDS